ncbi:hypothetical protein KUV44_08395 [Marinobacter daepoensis]|uniref:O-antigen ligase like membrane protein n=1 Tax=Marinobacter daepoensis TaxID=262077 RepID=A0ABS3BIK1_9GAMM|nr:hypothetical protein [Marinobacter daepoensis]MBN7771292.1 hypothetical protein [Marinobacter daepoensis]MBY6079154.1 hypothetical protein [Marinobacter daepoensis]
MNTILMFKLNPDFPLSIEIDRLILLFLALLYLAFGFASVFMGSSMFRLMGGLTGAFFIAYFLMVYRARVLVPALVALLMIVFILFSEERNLLSGLFFVLALFSSLCLSVLIRDYSLGFLLVKTPLVLFSFFLLYLHFVRGFGPNEFNDVFQGYSRNGVGSILLAFSIGYVWYCVEKGTRPSLLLGLIVFFLMFPLYGRANIFGGAVVFFLIAYLNIGLVGSFVLALLCFGVLAAGYGYISEFFLEKTNFGAGIESARSEMIKGYVRETDLKSLFLGTDLSKVEAIVEHGGNPHNSFLRAHSYFGLISIVMGLFFALGILLLLSNSLMVLTSLALVFLGRAYLDIIYFGNLFDFLMLGPFLHFFRPARSRLCL